MKIYLRTFTVLATLNLLGLGVSIKQVEASTLFIGPNGSFAKDINSINLITKKQLVLQAVKKQEKITVTPKRRQVRDTNLDNNTGLEAATALQQQGENNIAFQESSPDNQSYLNAQLSDADLETPAEIDNLMKDVDAEVINQDIRDRYYGLVEDDNISLIESNQLTKEILENEALTELNSENILRENAQLTEALINSNQLQTNLIDEPETNIKSELVANSAKGIFFGILLGGGAISLLAVNSLKSSENKGIFSLIAGIFGKTQIPAKAKDLHHKTFRKVLNLGKKLEKLDDEKFTSQEFILYLQLRGKINQGYRQKEPVCLSVKYLEVGILAQSSFLRLEQTELRYRSRNQQNFYNFVADNITDDIDKKAFGDRVQDKLIEIVPKINTEEGKKALQSYFDEVKNIAQYDLGLKLLSLFKKYQLADFTILRKVSDIVEQASAENLMTDDNLKLVVLENYETLKKLAPIIELEESDIKPQFFSKVLQYLALGRRYEKAFQEFQNLIKVLKQWENSYDSLKVIRQQYSNKEYSLPKEFYQDIPGLNVYHKYQEYLEKNR